MRIVKQNRFKNLGELHKEWTQAGAKASRATTHRHVKKFVYSCRIPLVKPLLNHRQRQRHLTWAKEKKNWIVAQWSKVLFSDESKFCISFGNQGHRVWRKGGEAHSTSCMKSSVKIIVMPLTIACYVKLCYVYCVRLTETCHRTFLSLLFC